MKSLIDMRNGAKIDGTNYKLLLKHIRLNVTDKYEFHPEIIKVNGTTVATLGNFSASTGKPKSKKTFNVSALVASALSGKEVLKYKTILPQGKERILYVDTEQSKCHCHKVMQRIMKLAGLPIDKEDDRILFFVLREYTPEQRREIISCALQEEENIGLVIIDGIRDLIHDINSPGESLNIINELMRWSSYYEMHIHTVLHQNKGDDNTRGHIGTELNNKAETILQVSKNAENPNISEVRAVHIRDKEFQPFAFEINEDALPQLVNNYKFTKTKEKISSYADMSNEQHLEALECAFKDKQSMGYQELLDSLKTGYASIGYARGRNTIVKLCKFLSNINVLIKEEQGYIFDKEPLCSGSSLV